MFEKQVPSSKSLFYLLCWEDRQLSLAFSFIAVGVVLIVPDLVSGTLEHLLGMTMSNVPPNMITDNGVLSLEH